MSYCTEQDLIDRFGVEELIQLTDRERAGVPDSAAIARAIGDAAAEIDGYLEGVVGPLPLSPAPAALVRVAADIARHNLYDQAATEQVRKRYEDAIRFLRGVARGEIGLGVAGEPAGSGGVVLANKRDPLDWSGY